jgi:hypothetical protein
VGGKWSNGERRILGEAIMAMLCLSRFLIVSAARFVIRAGRSFSPRYETLPHNFTSVL